MAQYYVDGTITSALGTGSGTLADPWGKTDDLLQFAIDQILAGAGKGVAGDWINIVDGNLTNTASTDFSSYAPSNGTPITILGYNGYQPTFDLGAVPFLQTAAGRDGIKLHNIRFINFSTSTYSLRFRYHGSVSFCVFDAENNPASHILRVDGAYNIYGCQWINFTDNTVNGLFFQTGSSGGNWMKGCYFEKSSTYLMVYVYNTVVEDCVFRYSGTGTMYYMVLPIRQVRLSNCTFYATPTAGSAFAVFFSTYQNNSMVNCYFENLAEPIYNSQNSVNDNISTMLAGNRAYNSTNLYPGQDYIPGKTLIYDNNDWDVPESLLIDPLNGDYRPRTGLIGAGFNLQDYGFPSSIKKARPTIGGINAFETVAKPVLRVRG
jgi:hypothetical protein